MIMWGPAKIPELARALGRAKGEFNNASKEFEKAANVNVTAATTTTAKPAVVTKTKEEILIDTARGLGIETEGKTQQQLSEEIATKAKLLSAQ